MRVHAETRRGGSTLLGHLERIVLQCLGDMLNLVLALQVIGYLSEEFFLGIRLEMAVAGCTCIRSPKFVGHPQLPSR